VPTAEQALDMIDTMPLDGETSAYTEQSPYQLTYNGKSFA
jgi:hypothetical protein